MLPQIRRVLDALDDRQRFVVSTPIAVAEVAIVDTRPKDAPPELWCDGDAQVCEARASTLFQVGEVHKEREQPHPLRRPVRALLIMVLPVKLADLVLEHLEVLGIFIGQHGDIQHPHCQVVDSLRSHASTAFVAPALRRILSLAPFPFRLARAARGRAMTQHVTWILLALARCRPARALCVCVSALHGLFDQGGVVTRSARLHALHKDV